MLVPIDQIVVPEGRHRKHLGDMQALAKSIARVGLLHPLVVSLEYRLISGVRRLAALRLLGAKDVPVRVVADLDNAMGALQAERRDDVGCLRLLPSEAVGLGRELERLGAETVSRFMDSMFFYEGDHAV